MGVIQRMISGLAVALALALGAGCLLAALAAQGGRFSAQLDLLTHFAPFWLLGALAVLAYGALLAPTGLRPTILVLGGLGVAAAAALILPELTRPIRPPVATDAPRQIKLIQFNAWTDNVDVNGTADWIARERPDIVVIQEVRQPIRDAMVKRGFAYQRGMVNTAIFSRIPVAPSPFQIPEPDWHVLPAFARATFSTGDEAFSVLGVHVSRLKNYSRSWQLHVLQKRLIDRYDRRRLILVGDFNLTPWSFTLRDFDRGVGLERRDRAMFSWPARAFAHGRLNSPLPLLPIDHIYAGSAWRTVKIERGPRLGSDHYPVVVVLALAD
jgi:endonuclease/exonuclease/phosphatase (EEP) superfamily protein YafD